MFENRFVVALFMAVVALPLSGVLEGCHKVPYTGRKQVIIMPKAQESAMGAQAYTDLLSEEKVSSNKAWGDIVKRVGQRVAKVTGESSYDWQFKLLAAETVNAFCLPGGKVAFYEGIMPVCSNEAGVAVVMGHEIGHAIARHGIKRMRQGIIVQLGALGVSVATQTKSEQEKLVLMGAYGALANLGFVLPFSRKHETEADHIGIMYMALAGYDPAEAPRFWGRMAQSGSNVPAFMSTHPKSDKRAEDLDSLMADAKKVYNAAKKKYGTGVAVQGSTSGSKSSTSGGSKESGSKDSGSSGSTMPPKKDTSGKKK